MEPITNGGNIPLFVANARASFQRAFELRNLPGMLKHLRVLEKNRRHLKADDVRRYFRMAAELSYVQKQYSQAFHLGVKARRMDAPGERAEDVRLLLEVWDKGGKDAAVAGELKPLFERLIKETIRAEIARMLPEEAMVWEHIIEAISPRDHFIEQRALIEKFLPTMEAGLPRAEMAARHIETSWICEIFFGIAAERGKVAASAKIALEDGREHIVTRLSPEEFFIFVANLEYFDLVELIEQAVAIRQPSPEDPAQYFVALSQEARTDLAAAYRNIHGSAERYQGLTTIQQNSLKYLQVKILRRYLDQQAKDQTTDLRPETWPDRLMGYPLHVDPQLQRQITAYLKSLLSLYKDEVVNRDPFWSFLKITNEGKHIEKEAYLVYQIGTNEFCIYLGSQADGRWLKVVMPVKKSGNTLEVSPEPEVVYQQVRREPSVGILMSIFGFLSARWKALRPELHQRLAHNADVVRDEISKAAGRLFQRENAAVFRAFSQALAADLQLQNRTVEMHNRLLLARTIFETYLKEIPDQPYVLQADDLLGAQSQSINFSSYEPLKTFMEQLQLSGMVPERKGKYPFAVVLQLRDNPEKGFFAMVHSPKKVVVPGIGELSGTEAEFVFDLIYEAAVKLSVKSAVDHLQQTGYLFQPGEEDEGGLGKLRSIYARYFRAQLAQGGLLALPWFTFEPIGRDEGLYHPLPDQSIAAKMAMLDKGGKDVIFVQMEPAGLVALLPVRYKKMGKEIMLAPWERQPLRERQQALLSDIRVLPTYYGLYILTYFSDGKGHAFRYLIKPTEAEILDDVLIADVEKRLGEGFFRDARVFLRGTPRKQRCVIEAGLAEGTLTIERQEVQAFQLNTTFKRPQMEKLSALLAQGFSLEIKN
jgi:hypothetical protein